MAGEKKTKRTKKRPPAAVLLVILALVAVLGIQIVKVYGQLKTAQREESVLNQQLTQQQQENDALRSDLSKKDDERAWPRISWAWPRTASGSSTT